MSQSFAREQWVPCPSPEKQHVNNSYIPVEGPAGRGLSWTFEPFHILSRVLSSWQLGPST